MLKSLDQLDREFHKIAGTLKKFELQRISPGADELGLGEIFGDLDHKGGSEFFMGFYSRQGVETVLERYGIWAMLRQKGFDDLHLDLDLTDPYKHRLMVYQGSARDESNRLVDLHVHRLSHPDERTFEEEMGHHRLDFLKIDWLELQNPSASFTRQRLPLPGQTNPGLGIGAEVMELLQIMAERLGLAGIVTRPNHYHNAVLYSLRYQFISPCVEGVMRAAMRDLASHSLAEASWAIYLGAVIDEETGQPALWHGREQLFPIHRSVARYFETAEYRRQQHRCASMAKFRLDESRFAKLKAESEEYNAFKIL